MQRGLDAGWRRGVREEEEEDAVAGVRGRRQGASVDRKERRKNLDGR